MGVTRLHRGVILWAGLIFFASATIAVALFNDLWTARHMGVVANFALAAGSWLTIALGKPFTLDYARQHTDPSLWNQAGFIRTNVVITSAWALVFTVNTVLAWGRMDGLVLPAWAYEVTSYVLLIGAVAFTIWYPGYRRRIRPRSFRPAPHRNDLNAMPADEASCRARTAPATGRRMSPRPLRRRKPGSSFGSR